MKKNVNIIDKLTIITDILQDVTDTTCVYTLINTACKFQVACNEFSELLSAQHVIRTTDDQSQFYCDLRKLRNNMEGEQKNGLDLLKKVNGLSRKYCAGIELPENEDTLLAIAREWNKSNNS